MAILTQRNFKDVCIYEDMAGAIFVLFLFGFCLLLVSVFLIGLFVTFYNYSLLIIVPSFYLSSVANISLETFMQRVHLAA